MNKVELERTGLEAVAGAGLGELERGSYLDMSEKEWEYRKLQSRVEGEGFGQLDAGAEVGPHIMGRNG